MIVQNFKGDAIELKMQEVANPLFDLTNIALDEFYEGGFEANEFLLMLYDESRMPFSERINRDAFVPFVKQALINFPVIGTFEVYLFILVSIFGADSEIRFYVTDAGKLEIDVEAATNSEFTFIGRQFVDGSYEFFDMIDSEGDTLILRGVAGIDTEYELNLLFSEIMPAGITPAITLGFFDISDFVDDDDDFITDDDDTGIIFVEGGA
jgi:hypothetical protein